MTAGKMSALMLGFVATFALGAWVGPHLARSARQAVAETAPAVAPEPVAALPSETAAKVTARSATSGTPLVAVTAPQLEQRLKPVLNRGADMSTAADGFTSAEEFATVAHAAHNTAVPFLLLKHRVLKEGRSVADAIRESKPAAHAAAEAELARAQARLDLVSVAG